MAMATTNMQEQEWKLAQDIKLSLDLISATKQHINFLAVVDRNSSWLCKDGPALQRAIYRYTTCWIPLLAKHTESPLFEGPLVVPLDCEWIWHCHRLNPLAYKSDSEELYGMILDNKNVVSSTQGTSDKETEVVWKNLYPNEAFELDPSAARNDNSEATITKARKFTNYDLTFSVQRQCQFFSQVSESHMCNDLYLEGAVTRYKGFLHLIKRCMENNINSFLAPTYDIDLVWHTHQLHPLSYTNDLENLVGMVLGHDDTITDRTKGQKLDVGYTATINSWADIFGKRYKRAGALHKFSTPEKKIINSDEEQNVMHLPELKIMEVMLEFVNVKDIPEEHKFKQLFVSFTKTQPDSLFMGKRILPISSKLEEKVASFQCEPTGMLLFELVASLPSSEELSQTLGSCSISLEDLLLPGSVLMVEKWLELIPSNTCESTKPVSLRMAISVTPPTSATFSHHTIHSASACVCATSANVCDASMCLRVTGPDDVPSATTNANACDASMCVRVTGHNGIPSSSACVCATNTNACDASMCVRVIGPHGIPSASACVCATNAKACDASMCVRVIAPNSIPSASACVCATNANTCDASMCVRAIGPCDIPSASACVCATNANICDASMCVRAIGPHGVPSASACVCATNTNICDASMCVRVIGASASGIPCA